MKKRIFSFLMVLVMLVTMLPANVLAQTVGGAAVSDGEYYALDSTIWLPDGEEPTQAEYPVDIQRGDQWVNTEMTREDLICEETHAHNYVCTEDCDKLHTHTDSCYGVSFTCTTEEHTHGSGCYETVWSCGIEETSGHQHTDACYGTKLVCGKDESEGHQHTEECGRTETRTCGLEENPGHQHGEGCPSAASATLSCGTDEAHAHTDACYNEAGELTCGKKTAHTHGDGCKDAEGNQTCTLNEVIEHVHSDACYIATTSYGCGMEAGEGAHTHTAACNTVTYANCSQTKGEGAHSHGDGCYGPDYENQTCGMKEGDGKHIHAENNCTSTEALLCTKDEHTHTMEACAYVPNYEDLICTLDPNHVCVTEGCAADCVDAHHTEDCYTTMVMWGVANYGLNTADEEQGLPIHFFIAMPGTDPTPTSRYYADHPYYENGGDGRIRATLAASDLDGTGIRNATEESSVTAYIDLDDVEKAALLANLDAFGENTVFDFDYGGRKAYSASQYDIVWIAVSRKEGRDDGDCYCSESDSHIHIDGVLSKKVQVTPENLKMTKEIPAAQTTDETFTFMMQKLVLDENYAPTSQIEDSAAPIILTATIPAGSTTAAITGANSQTIGFGYYKVTEVNNTKWAVDTVEISSSGGFGQTSTNRFEQDAVYVGIATGGEITFSNAYNGDYVAATNVTLENQRKNATVTYGWEGLPEKTPALAPLPGPYAVTVGGVHSVNTSYYEGYRMADPDTGEIYAFLGWQYYKIGSQEHNIEYDETGKIPNPRTLTVNSDIYVHGEWVKLDETLPTQAGQLILQKTFVGMTEVPDNFYIDITHNGVTTGIDMESHATRTTDYGNLILTYTYPVAANGEYIITEGKADNYSNGYKLTTASNDVKDTPYMTEVADSDTGSSVTVNITLPYNTTAVAAAEGEDTTGNAIQVGTVAFTNTYEMRERAETVYPDLRIYKYDDTGTLLPGATFKLTPAAGTEEAERTLTTDVGGYIDFTDIPEGSYTLEETVAPENHALDDTTYYVEVTSAGEEVVLKAVPVLDADSEPVLDENGVPKTEMAFVTVTSYDVAVYETPATDTTDGEATRPLAENFEQAGNVLSVVNDRVMGTMIFTKTFTGIDESDFEDDANIRFHVTNESGFSEYVTVHAISNPDTEETHWQGTLENLLPGEYTVTESNASIHGYNWKGATITVDSGEPVRSNSITVDVSADADSEINITIQNTYEPWTKAELIVHKVDNTLAENHLGGAVFYLYNDAECTDKIGEYITDDEGETIIGNLGLKDEDATESYYYLKEITAPNGHTAQEGVVYEIRVFIADATTGGEDSDAGDAAHEKLDLEVTELGNYDTFNHGTDTLKVVNRRQDATLTITKAFKNNVIPDEKEGNEYLFKGIDIVVSGPNINQPYVLNRENNWTIELPAVTWGTYHITETSAQADGYVLKSTTYSVDDPDAQATGTSSSGTYIQIGANALNPTVTITNEYEKQEKSIHNPTYFNILKLDRTSGEPIDNATFTLYTDKTGENQLEAPMEGFTVSATTNGQGIANFANLRLPDSYGESATFYLKESGTPAGYQVSEDVWEVTMTRETISVDKLSADKSIFESIFGWIVNLGKSQTEETVELTGDQRAANNQLVVYNTRKPTTLTVTKEVRYVVEGVDITDTEPGTVTYLKGLVDENDNTIVENEYAFNVSINGTAQTNPLALEDGETSGPIAVNYNDTWSVRETAPGNADYYNLTSITINGEPADSASGTIAKDASGNPIPVEVVLTNTYYFNKWDDPTDKPVNDKMTLCLEFDKIDGVSKNALDGATFNLYAADKTTVIGTATSGASMCKNANAGEGKLHFHIDDTIQTTDTATYYLKETQAPAGYALSEEYIEIQVEKQYHRVEHEDKLVTVKKLVVTNLTDFTIENTPATGVINFSKIFETRPSSTTDDSNSELEYTGRMSEQDLAGVEIVMHVHGPVERTGGVVTSGMDNVRRITLSANEDPEKDWKAQVDELPVGEYLIHEAFASVHGYTWDAVDYGAATTVQITEGQYADTYVSFNVTGEKNTSDTNKDNLGLNVTNKFTAWEAADFYIRKIDSITGSNISGTDFALYDDYIEGTGLQNEVTDTYYKGLLPNGYYHFGGFTVDDTKAEVSVDVNGKKVYSDIYYLHESSPSANYKGIDTIWQVIVSHSENKYDLSIEYFKNQDNAAGTNDVYYIDGATDTLTVKNEPILGSIQITKAFTGDLGAKTAENPDGVQSVSVHVTGPNGYDQNHTLSWEAANGVTTPAWTANLTGLRMGDYTITEVDASRNGYDWTVSYTGGTVAEDGKSITVTLAPNRSEAHAEVTVTNNYDKRTYTDIRPAELTIYKTDENGQALSGAEFTLYEDQNCTTVYKTSEELSSEIGVYRISDIAGQAVADITKANLGEKTYYLKETKAPAGHIGKDRVWAVTVSADGTTLKLDELNPNSASNFFETVIHWLLRDIPDGTDFTYDNGRLTVVNEAMTTDLTVTKTVKFLLDGDSVTDSAIIDKLSDVVGEDTEYIISTTVGAQVNGEAYEAGESKVYEDIPYGTYYHVAEYPVSGAAYTVTYSGSPVTGHAGMDSERNPALNASGGIDPISVEVVNTYSFWSWDDHVADGSDPIGENLETCLVFRKVDANSEKPLGGAVLGLYLNGSQLETQTTSADGYVHFHVCTAGKYVLKELTAPAGYDLLKDDIEINVTETWHTGTKDGKTVIYNKLTPDAGTKAEPMVVNNSRSPIDLTVNKVWNDSNYHDRPNYVKVELLCDGKTTGKTTILSSINKWSHTWRDLDPYHNWSVRETAIGDGYTVSYSDDQVNYLDGEQVTLTITNTRKANPIRVTVKKVWKGGTADYATMKLYENGKVIDMVKLSKDNNWTYTWKLDDSQEYTVDEVRMSGFYKKVTHTDNDWTVTNTVSVIPQTGDYILIAAGIMTAAGAALIVLFIIAKNKRKQNKA